MNDAALIREWLYGVAMTVFDFDDPDRFTKVLNLEVPWAHSYAETKPGNTDRERRENYRNAAVDRLGPIPHRVLWWAFRISVLKSGRQLDVDNVPKTIIDAFCSWQIAHDASPHNQLGLYPDDTFDHVRVLQVSGSPADTDRTTIEIFACICAD